MRSVGCCPARCIGRSGTALTVLAGDSWLSLSHGTYSCTSCDGDQSFLISTLESFGRVWTTGFPNLGILIPAVQLIPWHLSSAPPDGQCVRFVQQWTFWYSRVQPNRWERVGKTREYWNYLCCSNYMEFSSRFSGSKLILHAQFRVSERSWAQRVISNSKRVLKFKFSTG